MRTLRRPRKMAKLRSVETKIVKDVEEEMMKRLWRPRQRGIRMSRRMNRLRKMICHQLPRDTRKPAQILQSLNVTSVTTRHMRGRTSSPTPRSTWRSFIAPRAGSSSPARRGSRPSRTVRRRDSNAPNALRSLRLLEPSIGIIGRNT